MPECPIEIAQIKILLEIAEKGKKAAEPLSYKYRTNEVGQAAMKALVFGKDGAFARCVVIDAIGMAGNLEDVEHVLMHVLGHKNAKNRKAYSGRKEFGNAILSYSADGNDSVRETAMGAILSIARRQAVVFSKEAEWALVESSAVDPSEIVRESSSRLLASYGSRAAFNLFFTFMINAEKANDLKLLGRFNESLGAMVKEMEKTRVRGSFLKAFLGLSSSSDALWKLAERNILEMYAASKIQNEIYQMVAKEQGKLRELRGEKNELSAKRIGNLLKSLGKDPTASLKRKRMTAEAEMAGEIVPPPKQMVRKNESVPPGGRVQDDWDYDKVIVSRGPVVDALCAAGRKIKMAFRGAKGPRR